MPHCNYDQLNFDVLHFLQTAAAHVINKAISKKIIYQFIVKEIGHNASRILRQIDVSI